MRPTFRFKCGMLVGKRTGVHALDWRSPPTAINGIVFIPCGCQFTYLVLGRGARRAGRDVLLPTEQGLRGRGHVSVASREREGGN